MAYESYCIYEKGVYEFLAGGGVAGVHGWLVGVRDRVKSGQKRGKPAHGGQKHPIWSEISVV